MASKQPFKLLDIKNKLINIGNKMHKFAKHSLLFQPKSVLILHHSSEQTSPFIFKLKEKFKKNWNIHQINLHEVKTSDEMNQIQNQYVREQFDAIIVSPLSNKSISAFHHLNEPQFATNMSNYQGQLFSNILAYRIAHKRLSTGGVLIFTNSEQQWKESSSESSVEKFCPLKNILHTQISYLSVLVGDRQYTKLNSWSVTALSQESIDQANEDFVVDHYKKWANGQNLPLPGSFAMFKSGKFRPYVHYL